MATQIAKPVASVAALALTLSALAAGPAPARPKLGKFMLGADISALDSAGRAGARGRQSSLRRTGPPSATSGTPTAPAPPPSPSSID